MNVKKGCLKLLSFNPLASLLRCTMLSRRIAILMYHEVLEDERELDAWTVLKSSDFVWQMEFLKRHFDVISLYEALSLLKGGTNWNRRPKAVVTFDDGYAGNARCVLPIIEAMNIPVAIFVATGAVETGVRYWYDKVILALQPAAKDIILNLESLGLGIFNIWSRVAGECRWTCIQSLLSALKTLLPRQRAIALDIILQQTGGPGNALADLLSPMSIEDIGIISKSPLVTIGAHSHCHNILVQLEDKEASESIENCKKRLEQWTEKQVRFFAYPNGDFNDQVIKCVVDAGFQCGLTTIERAATANDNLFTLPRIGIGRFDTREHFSARVSGLRLP